METKTITVKNIRPLWQNKNGMPKKECLLNIPEILKNIGIKLTGSKADKAYSKALCNSVVHAVRTYFKEHNVNWIDPKIGKKVYHGFSKKKEYIEDSLLRSKGRMKVTKISFSKHKELSDTQLELTFSLDAKK